MNINHNYDIYNRKEPSIIYLAQPGKNILCAINGIDSSSVSIEINTNNTTTLSFTVNKYINENIVSNAYDDIEEMMELYCDGIWFKIVDPPSISYDGLQETKEVTAESYEIMLSQYLLNDFKVNTGDKSSYEMQYKRKYDLNCKGNPDHDPDYISDEYFSVTFYNPDCQELSLLHLILKHANLDGIWSIGYIDNTPSQSNDKSDKAYLKDYQYFYEVDNKSVYTFLTQEVASACRCIFEFDTVNMTINAYRPEGLGKDTELFLSFRNIQNNISISRDSSLITQFYVSGMSDYNIDSVNFKNSLITDYSHFMNDRYMPLSLQQKYKRYVDYKESKRDTYVFNSKVYNYINEKLTELKNRVPIDNVKNDWFSSSVKDLKSAYNSNTAIILGIQKLYVDDNNNFDINELKKHQSDWDLYDQIMSYTLPAIIAALHSKGIDGSEAIDELNKLFENNPKFKIKGNGNILSNVNPVVINTDWIIITNNSRYDYCRAEDVSIDLDGCNGINRGFKFDTTYKEPEFDPDNPGVIETPVYGTGGMPSSIIGSFENSYGVVQQKISINVDSYYCLSCYIKQEKLYSDGYFCLKCGRSSTTFKSDIGEKKFVLQSANQWQKCSMFFKSQNNTLINVAFIECNGDDTYDYTKYMPFHICGMQLEEITEEDYNNNVNTTNFGYFIESEDSIKSYETNWDLYGIDELKTKIKVYENCLIELKKKGFSTTASSFDLNCDIDYYSQMKQCYNDYQALIDQATKALTERQAEYDNLLNGVVTNIDIGDTRPVLDKDGNPLKDEKGNDVTEPILYTVQNGMTGADNIRSFLAKDVDMNNWGINWKSDINVNLDNNYKYLSTILSESELADESFNDEDLKTLLLLSRQAVYTNENIDITSIDTSVTAINQVKKLYDDAVNELYIESHPQYTYSDTIENIYALPELRDYHDKFNVNDFVHVELNDGSYITLRLIKISYNPCDLDESMEITFSNMIQYKAKRNDFNILLEGMTNTSSHDAGSIQGKSNDGGTMTVSTEVIQQLLSSPMFTSKVTSSNSNINSSVTMLQQQVKELQDKVSRLLQMNS